MLCCSLEIHSELLVQSGAVGSNTANGEKLRKSQAAACLAVA